MDNAVIITLIALGLLFFFMFAGMWISAGLGLTGLILMVFFVGRGAESGVAYIAYNVVNSFTFSPLPLFILMGELLLHSGLSARLYKGANALVGFLPGGLLLTNILSCSFFAAVSGSSSATAITIGSVAIPEELKRGYDRKWILGSICAGGTLGVLIPPSSTMIIYGAFVEESIAKLFMAGVFPGIMLAGIMMVTIIIASMLRPGLAPQREKFSLSRAASSVSDIWPLLVLIVIVLGSIYLGLATPTEAASLGVAMALALCAILRRLTWQVVKGATVAALRTTAWIMLIVIGALVMSTALAYLRIPSQLAAMVTALDLNRMVVVALVFLMYMLLGCIIDVIGMMLLTLPVTYPLMMSLGFDSVWFGIALVILAEMAAITPPVGMNLYVVYSMSDDHWGDVARGIIPFFFSMLVALILITIFPDIALWLPNNMIRPWR